ncbi:MAG: amidohydrolase family protein [Phycisphaerales bacterium JB065]
MDPRLNRLVSRSMGTLLACSLVALCSLAGTAHSIEPTVEPETDASAPAQADSSELGLQDPPPRPRRRPPDGRRGPRGEQPEAAPAPQPEPEKAPDEDVSEDEPDWLALTGGTVHTVTGPTVDGATVLCKNGKIFAVGHRVSIPEGATVIDASGYHIYPGLIGMDSSNIIGRGNPADTTDVYGLSGTLARAAGLTTLVSGNTVAKNKKGTVEGMVVASNMFENLQYATNQPRRRAEVRKGFEEARDFMRRLQQFQQDRPEGERPPQERELGREARSALRILRGEAKAQAFANDAASLIALAELAVQYDFEIVVRGATEGWTVPERLAQAKVSAIVVPRDRTFPDERTNRPTGATIENAAILTRHGIDVAVLPPGPYFGPGTGIGLSGLGGRDMLNINMSAAYAMRGGLTEDQAVRTLTINPARILGVDDRLGSIEVGKDADMIVTDRPLVDYMMLVRYAIIDGEIAYDKDAEGIFAHIRPADPEAEHPLDAWPRRLGAPW